MEAYSVFRDLAIIIIAAKLFGILLRKSFFGLLFFPFLVISFS